MKILNTALQTTGFKFLTLDSHKNKDLKKILYIILITLINWSCSDKTFDNRQELWEYLKNPENEFLQSKTVNGVEFSLVYKPTDLLVEQEASSQPSLEEIDSLRNKYRNYLYFNLSMSRNNQELLSNVAGDKQRFGSMVNQLAFGMEQQLHFYTGKKDTIPLTDYIYPRMYGMSGTTTLLLVYPKEEQVTKSEEMTLSIEDLGFYTGEVKFKIPTRIFKQKLQLEF